MIFLPITPVTPRGFVALMATIIIGAILLVLTATLAQSGFNLRYQVLGLEYKTLSVNLAKNCTSKALLSKIQNPSYVGNSTSTELFGVCYIAPLAYIAANNRLEITVTAIVSGSYTTTQSVYDMHDIFLGPVPRSVQTGSRVLVSTLLSSRELTSTP